MFPNRWFTTNSATSSKSRSPMAPRSRSTPSGHYALQIAFSDGHDSGIFTWAYLRELGETHTARWADYLAQLEAAGASREPTSHTNTEASRLSDAACGCGQGGCAR
jgi:hypothetical protein